MPDHLLTVFDVAVSCQVSTKTVLRAIGGVFKDNANHAAGFGAYAALAWLGAAIGTVAGALGTKLENIDEVRHATYGHNQCRRRESRSSER